MRNSSIEAPQMPDDDVVAILTSTPALLHAMLDSAPADAIDHRAPGAWSAREVLAHLILGERNDWIPRVRHLLAHGEALPFVPFVREDWGGLPQAELATLLATFAAERQANLATLRALALGSAELARMGRHPKLGRVTLGELLTTWAVHDLTHVDQLVRLRAQRLASATGPWNHPEYLGVLWRDKPAAHGSS